MVGEGLGLELGLLRSVLESESDDDEDEDDEPDDDEEESDEEDDEELSSPSLSLSLSLSLSACAPSSSSSTVELLGRLFFLLGDGGCLFFIFVFLDDGESLSLSSNSRSRVSFFSNNFFLCLVLGLGLLLPAFFFFFLSVFDLRFGVEGVLSKYSAIFDGGLVIISSILSSIKSLSSSSLGSWSGNSCCILVLTRERTPSIITSSL
mmetsp:Transcript_41715/g.100061  ORF Transcript_41715/g.100061 Transcript_41715/m.100061 type:complete len:206 (-) Transcript_41715:521-1138(-)